MRTKGTALLALIVLLLAIMPLAAASAEGLSSYYWTADDYWYQAYRDYYFSLQDAAYAPATYASSSTAYTYPTYYQADASTGAYYWYWPDSYWDWTSSSSSGTFGYIGNCETRVNVREGPGTANEIIGKVYPGEWVEVLSWNATATWCKVIYDGGNKAGWISAQYVVF